MSDDGLEIPVLLSEEQVAEFLSANPEFFRDRDELLSKLTIPHQRGDAISLVERQVSVLRERNADLRERLNNLLSIARDNDRLFERVRRLVLSVMEAQTLDSLIDAVDDSLSHDFRIEYVNQFLVSDIFPGVSRVDCYPKQEICSNVGISDLLDGNRVVCGKLREKELKFLFPNHWKLVKSSAVVPLHCQRPLGVLVVGSRDEEDFRVGTGTVYLSFIGEVLSRALADFIPVKSTSETSAPEKI
ncbi:DUF484 family protein [Parendozoicomonas haliclonae]|uniref:DUF484 family protein n=1 Tax=Parendozoicomonas haliclonae TaxID=1960125 RepID=A0A1X7AKY3_9GAMM|nr:DUF484 family protein [Parendozoicomonas haliclonae]SMA48465.1 hypothetical protein EHSB41UT_02753 [Parendozoicomonas haliclonae]